MENKTCTKCKIEFPATIEYFTPSKRYKHGMTSSCKICRKEYAQIYRKENPEKVKKSNENWMQFNRDFNREWYIKNPNKALIYYNKRKDNLTDSYIAASMRRLTNEISPEIINTQRLIIQLKRELCFGSGIKRK